MDRTVWQAKNGGNVPLCRRCRCEMKALKNERRLGAGKTGSVGDEHRRRRKRRLIGAHQLRPAAVNISADDPRLLMPSGRRCWSDRDGPRRWRACDLPCITTCRRAYAIYSSHTSSTGKTGDNLRSRDLDKRRPVFKQNRSHFLLYNVDAGNAFLQGLVNIIKYRYY